MSGYANRAAAGLAIAGLLERLRGQDDVIVLGLPRGGVPVAYEVARALELALDVLIVRKIGMPGQPELALGAVAGGGTIVINDALAERYANSAGEPSLAILRESAGKELMEVSRREALFRRGRAPLDLSRRTAVLVDDGAATGASMLAAVRCARALGARHIIVALPVASDDAVRLLAQEADELVCPLTPHPFHAVGDWYRDFTQTQDREVTRLLHEASPDHADH